MPKANSTSINCCKIISGLVLILVHRAATDIEPKIRMADEILILLPKKIAKAIVFVCTTIAFICLFISSNYSLQQCLILNFLLVIVMENVYFACLFLESIKC